jgi:hypothetical protein
MGFNLSNIILINLISVSILFIIDVVLVKSYLKLFKAVDDRLARVP